MLQSMLRGASFSLVLILVLSPLRAEDWPGWRGPTGQGQSREKGLPLTWDGKTGTNVLWKMPLLPEGTVRPDQNQSSPIVQGERVWVTLSYWPEGTEPKGNPPEHHALSFSTRDGKRLSDTRVPPGPWKLTDLRGGYTAPTPACDGSRVYVAFGSAVLAALDLEGKLLWRREIVPHAFDVAMAVSPVIVGETVILVCDFTDAKKSRLLAFDCKTGEPKWEQSRAGQGFCHSTPVLATVQGMPQLLIAGAGKLQGVDPASGQVRWSCDAVGDTVSPVLGQGVVYIDSGRGSAGYAIDPTGMGNVTATHTRWKINPVPQGFSSPVIVGEHLYRLHNPGTLTCRTLSEGKIVYQERLPGVSIASSPIATADGRIYCASSGKSFVVQAGPSFKLLATNDLDDPSQTSPAIAGGKLFLKGSRWLWCVGAK